MRSTIPSILLLLAAPVAAGEPVPPKPLGNPGTWATSDDYPLSALREEIGGVVRFVLGVSADGAVTDCTVRESSGDTALDARTCELLSARGRFTPATDEQGRAVPGTWTSAVRWEIPETNPIPPEAALRYRFVVEKNGDVSNCEVLESPAGVPTDAICKNFSQRSFAPSLDGNGEPVRTEVTTTMRNEHRRLDD